MASTLGGQPLSNASPTGRVQCSPPSPGPSNAEIAHELFVSPATVKIHVASTFAKLELRDRGQAVIFAFESDLVPVHRR